MRVLIAIALGGLAVTAHGATLSPVTLSPVHPGDALRIAGTDATLDPTVRKAAGGEELVAVTFEPAPRPSLLLAPKQGAWSWPVNGTMRWRLQNGMPWPVTLIVDVASGAKHLTATVGLPPGPPMTLSLPLHATSPRAFGMQVGPPMPFAGTAGGKAGGGAALAVIAAPTGVAGLRLVATTVDGAIDAGAVTAVTLSMPSPGAPQTILLGQLDTAPGDGDLRAAYAGIVDRFGQYTRATWPEKVADHASLKARANAAPAAPKSTNLDRFGGRTDLPAMRATGWFHTQKQGDRWWLVSPEGHAFFSLGVNAVNLTDGRTYVQGREFMFADPAAANGRFGGVGDSRSDQGSQRDNGMNHGRWWDVYANNVARSFGDGDVRAAWRKRTIDRLKAWRFNTLGNWSDPAFSVGASDESRIAYTVPILIKGDFNSVSTGFDYWGRMPDPFDPRFAAATQAAVAKATTGVRDDPWLLGYFADNELAWAGQGPQGRWALAIGTLAQGPASPAKQAFLAYLEKTHGDIATFAKAWGVPVTRWDAVATEGFRAPPPDEAHPAIAVDYIAFLKLYAAQYFRTVAETLKKADPHHLFLGGRLAVRTPEVEEASAAYADVTSINTYTDVPEHGFDVAAFRKLDKPVLITEFHFGSPDRGPFGSGLAAVANEEERGKAYARFVDAAASSGVVVGTHWFQYVDQPVTGRILDGENAHIGLVGITDIPFEGFTRAVTETNARIGGGSGGR
ncbi:beta-agarase [Luteibacter jiangsuensis]|uniref:Beta-agarase n=1 Tax=Luteibacter jiangsuensis TaxID=637577 RepID=A0ABX0Q8U0_9GAMM|nr:beta-agarase [Luteibacter jiangsuensis]NID06969.1 beta-agarase [Luteibacter jiangsuensis]